MKPIEKKCFLCPQNKFGKCLLINILMTSRQSNKKPSSSVRKANHYVQAMKEELKNREKSRLVWLNAILPE